MNDNIEVGNDKGYAPQIDENQNNSPENNNNVSQQYPVDIKQGDDLSNSTVEDPIIKAQLRNGFIRKVFGIVTFQLIFSFLFILFCQTKIIKQFISKHQTLCTLLLTTSIICFIVFTCILACNRRIARKVPHNYILLFFITLSESITCSSVALQYSFEIVVSSIVLTIAAALGIIIYTLRTKSDLSGCKMGLMAFISQLFFFGFLNLFIRSSFFNLLYSFAGTALVGFYLVYDAQLISGKFGNEYSIDDFVFAAMELYIDIIRLFIEILRIIGRFQKK